MNSFFTKLENNKALVAVKEGMVLAIPTLTIGSIALLFKTFPVSSYQQFIYKELDGMIIDTLSLIHNTTLGIISLIVLLSISYSYGKANKSEYSFIIPIVAMCSFLVFIGIGNLKNTIEVFNVNWIFTSIVIAITSSILFLKLTSCFSTKFKYYTEGADLGFNIVISSILPFAIVVIIYSILHNILINVFGEVNIQLMFLDIAFKVFDDMGRNLLSALIFIFLMHIMWFFGIHGSNVLDNVAKDLFQSGMQVNIGLIRANKIPTEIFTKTFFDTMVLFGGCGTLLCLVIAIFVVGKRRSVKSLAKMALIPALFNMNEILVFGVPIVLNPSLFIPFILTPIVLTVTSYIAMSIGLVPYTVSPVEWTTPIFFSGYISTKSLRGSLLQIFNLFLGVLIYIPFIKMTEDRHIKIFKANINKLSDIVKECEVVGEYTNLLGEPGKLGAISRMLLEDMKYAIDNEEIDMFYQPQVNYDGEILGAEALLRWNHSIGGYLYPPLLVSLAKEGELLNKLGEYTIDKTCKCLKEIENIFEDEMKISVNISPDQLKGNYNLPSCIKQIIDKYNVNPKMIGIEITEQVALSGSKIIEERMEEMRNLGVKLIMDDFGMGHSSLINLKSNNFDMVKLDGSLVKEILINDRSSNIIESIVHLSNSLDFNIMVEYVETIEQREKLKKLGCENYQGYLYSKAIPFNDFVKYIRKNEKA